MAGISIQFHAIPAEILPVVRSFVEQVKAHIVSVRFPPFSAVEVEPKQLEELFDDASVNFMLTLQPPVLPASNILEFIDHNPGALTLDVGRRSAKGLEESWLSVRTQDMDAVAVWRKLAKLLRSMTKAGATAVNPTTGATGVIRDHRFSPGAEALERQGVPMLVPGKSLLKFRSS